MTNAQASVRTEGNIIVVSIHGREWRLDYSQDFDELWESMDPAEMDDDHIPYWAMLWPASLMLADWIFERRNEIAGRSCLELGCGMGLTAMAANALGARVLACDLLPRALMAARGNALMNGLDSGAGPGWVAMDWRRPAVKAGSIWRLWGADILYENRSLKPVLAFMGHALSAGGEAWLAEPGRGVFTPFLDMAAETGWHAEAARKERVPPIDKESASSMVTIWRVWRK